MNTRPELFAIGGFAQLTGLSIKALRLYDQLGLLQPRHIDPQSGYRYYDANQLSSARMMRIMREMDMPLATIRQVLAVLENSPAEAEALVDEYVEQRERQVKQLREQVLHLSQLLQQEVIPMSLEVNVKKIAPQQVLSLSRRVKVDKLDLTIKQSLDMLYALLKEQNAGAAEAPFGIFHGSINEQEDGPIEICLPVNAEVQTKGDIVIKTLPGGNAASVMMRGAQCDFPAILSGYDAAADWIQKNGYEMAERPREVWYNLPSEKAAKMEGADIKMEIVWMFK